MTRTPTREQYECLRDYTDGPIGFRPHGLQPFLVLRGWLYRRHDGAYLLTAAGREALAAYRERHGIDERA